MYIQAYVHCWITMAYIDHYSHMYYMYMYLMQVSYWKTLWIYQAFQFIGINIPRTFLWKYQSEWFVFWVSPDIWISIIHLISIRLWTVQLIDLVLLTIGVWRAHWARGSLCTSNAGQWFVSYDFHWYNYRLWLRVPWR